MSEDDEDIPGPGSHERPPSSGRRDESELPVLPLEGEPAGEEEKESFAELLGERYETVSLLGRGAFGDVLRARDRVLGREVAVKRIRLNAFVEAAQLEEVQKRFLREAQVAAQLRHPNIVTTHDIVSTATSSFIVMELVEGDTLQTTLQARGRLPLSEALGVLSQVASALDHAHAAGVVHRDVKPGNIMIEPSGHVKVMDFGIARLDAAANLTSTGLILGTPSYMSPEQARGERVDGRADVFSLGCVLYECLTGQKPFKGEGLTAILLKILTEPLPPLESEELGLPPALDSVLRRAVAKEPSQRFASAAELVEAARLAEAHGTPAPPPPEREGSGTVMSVRPALDTSAPGPSQAPPTPGGAALPEAVGRGGSRLLLAAGLALAALLVVGVLGLASLDGGRGSVPPSEGRRLVVEEELGFFARLLGRRPRVFVTLPAATRLDAELQTALTSATARPGDRFSARLTAPVRVEGFEGVPEGSRLLGRLSHAASAEEAQGRGALTLDFRSIVLPDGREIEVETAPVVLRAPPPRRQERKKGFMGEIQKLGAAVGELITGKTGEDVGGVAGASVSSSEAGTEVELSPGNSVAVQLAAPVTVAHERDP